MNRIIYSGITKTILAFTLIFCCCVSVHYGFLTLRGPLLYGNSDTVYETRQYSELFSKYVERTAVYVRYREDGYNLSTEDLDSELALLLNGEVTDEDLESALFNVYEPSETAFYYYHAKLNEEPTNYQYYVENTETGEVYSSANFERYATEKSGSLEAFLTSGIINENLYLILNTGNNRTMTGGGNADVLNRSNLLWSMDFLRRPLAEMAEDLHYDYNYHISNDSAHTSDMDHLESVSNSDDLPLSSSKPRYGGEIKIEEGGMKVEIISPEETEQYFSNTHGTPSSDILPPEPPNGTYLLYAFVAENSVEDDFTKLSQNFTSSKEDFGNSLQSTVLYTLLSIFLFIICNVLSGRRASEEGIHLHFYDRFFAEIILLALVGWFIFPFLMWHIVSNRYWETSLSGFIADYPRYNQWVPFFHGCMVLFLFVSGILYFSLIRRIKAKTFLSSSLLGRFVFLPIKKLLNYIGANLKEFYQHLPSLGKTFLYLGGGILWLAVSIVLFLLEQPIPALVILLLGALFCAVLCLRNMLDRARISQSTAQMSDGNLSIRISTKSMLPSNKNLSENINQICDGLHSAVEEQTKSERMKTELITNVSHDIKTPLTSIINYIELIKNELPQEGKIAGYAEILSQKSWRLKALIDDLVEASKAASGTMKLEPIRFNAVELLRQAVGDFEERLTEQNLTLCMELPETPVNVLADGACTHRIIENMLSNVCKYALSGTRVFVSLDLPEGTGLALLTVKNTSASVLTKTPEELLTRFSRGNDDRSGEGSGLGLSIAESLAELQGGSFYVEIDGDLFKAKLTIPLAE
ncbi:MAG: HAMP domain-containing histidine kinase [Lachnospiraceae bacterium]|nr:HAMP domain-containing histidine kinase [Lachnospiraceae bacterium]